MPSVNRTSETHLESEKIYTRYRASKHPETCVTKIRLHIKILFIVFKLKAARKPMFVSDW